ncbi:hypothetical protein FQR65_LT20501 [Abscondita terminalis]|nr:hypothetical protein FQR65_LT20501 [Abscondita terminalis]
MGYTVNKPSEVRLITSAYTSIASGDATSPRLTWQPSALMICTPAAGGSKEIPTGRDLRDRCGPGLPDRQENGRPLANTVTVNTATNSAMMADTIARFKEGKPVLYTPGRRTGCVLFPAGRAVKDIDTKLPNGANYGFPVNTSHCLPTRPWAEKNPQAAKLFVVMKLGPLADIKCPEMAMMHNVSLMRPTLTATSTLD